MTTTGYAVRIEIYHNSSRIS